MLFGERIKMARESRGLTPSALADKIGVTRATIHLWESGNSKGIDGLNLVTVARALNTTPDYIMTGKHPTGTDALTPEDEELIRLFHLLSESSQAHVLGLLRDISSPRLVPAPPPPGASKGD